MDAQEFNSQKYFDLISEISEHFRKSKEYQQAVELLFECWQNQGVVFTMGCGGSSSTATHFAGDLAKTVIPKYKARLGFKAMP